MPKKPPVRSFKAPRFHHISSREARNVAREIITASIVRVHGVTAVRCAAVSTSPECGPNPRFTELQKARNSVPSDLDVVAWMILLRSASTWLGNWPT